MIRTGFWIETMQKWKSSTADSQCTAFCILVSKVSKHHGLLPLKGEELSSNFLLKNWITREVARQWINFTRCVCWKDVNSKKKWAPLQQYHYFPPAAECEAAPGFPLAVVYARLFAYTHARTHTFSCGAVNDLWAWIKSSLRAAPRV